MICTSVFGLLINRMLPEAGRGGGSRQQTSFMDPWSCQLPQDPANLSLVCLVKVFFFLLESKLLFVLSADSIVCFYPNYAQLEILIHNNINIVFHTKNIYCHLTHPHHFFFLNCAECVYSQSLIQTLDSILRL